MIAYLKGKIIDKTENVVVVETNGIGYEVNISLNTSLSLSNKTECELFTYLQVREDGVFLFGFATKQEKELFLKLITVSGVGPKMAITILGGASLADILTAIVCEDSKFLSKFKGVGKKTAERIVLELKENVNNNLTEQNSALDFGSIDMKNNVVEDTIMALVALGLNKSDAVKKIRENYSDGDSTELLIEKILKNLSR
ncbi:MAG: Holliday junction branch migration protein RuvA [Christensenellales bacterium]